LSFILLIICFLALLWLLWYSLYKRWRILVFWCLLLFYGRAAMFSVSIHESFQYTRWLFERGILEKPDNYFFFFDQIKNMVIALAIWWITIILPWKFIKKRKYLIFAGSFILVILLLWPLGQDYGKWATLWLEIAGSTVQPWEFLKIWFVFLISARLVKKRRQLTEWQLYVGFLIISALSLAVFVALPDFWSLLVLWPVALILYRYAWWRIYYIWVTILMSFFLLMFAYSQYTYVQERVDFYINPWLDENSRGIWRQTNHALTAVWSWGLFGKWYGKWLQKLWYIPEAQSDFIFAAFSEEVGLFWNFILLCLYMWLARAVFRKFPDIHDQTDKTMAIWFLWLILMQAFVNMGVNINLLPLTGITLPFVSHGGSALMVNIVEVVLLRKILENRES